MNASVLTVIAVVGVLAIKIFSWYIDKPRRIKELKERISKLETELSYALIHNDSVSISRINFELRQLRSQLADLDPK